VTLSRAEIDGLGVAFNEATWLEAEIDEARRIAAITLDCLTLPPEGPAPEDSRVQVLLRPVGRVCAVHLSPTGSVLPLVLSQLLPTVQSFGGMPIYGWQFVDVAFTQPAQCSLDLSLGSDGLTHNLYLFQEAGIPGDLDLWIWFDELSLHRADGTSVRLDDFIGGGRRWWDGLYAGDPRTAGKGVAPLKGGGA
jgi:hypothetical protein